MLSASFLEPTVLICIYFFYLTLPILKHELFLHCADNLSIQISGNPDVAREALLEIASRLRTRTFRSGNAPSNPASMVSDCGLAPPSERMSGRGLPSTGMFGAAGNMPSVYPAHGFTLAENVSSRGPPSSSMFRAGKPVSYEYPEHPKVSS